MIGRNLRTGTVLVWQSVLNLFLGASVAPSFESVLKPSQRPDCLLSGGLACRLWRDPFDWPATATAH